MSVETFEPVRGMLYCVEETGSFVRAMDYAIIRDQLAASRERNELTTKLADQQSALLRANDETITMLRLEVKELEKQLAEYRTVQEGQI